MLVRLFNQMDDKVGGSVDTKARPHIFSFASVIFGTYMSEMWSPNEVNVHQMAIRTGAENGRAPPKLTTLARGAAGADRGAALADEARRPPIETRHLAWRSAARGALRNRHFTGCDLSNTGVSTGRGGSAIGLRYGRQHR